MTSSHSIGARFERDIVQSLNRYYLEENVPALAYRRYAPPRHVLEFDVLSDSINPRYYFAVECKSLSLAWGNKLYFSSFSTANNQPQMETEARWLEKTGRNAYFVVEFRAGAGNRREAYSLPWGVVYAHWRAGMLSMPAEWIREKGVRLGREGTQYCIDSAALFI
jgi:hypothetical protein